MIKQKWIEEQQQFMEEATKLTPEEADARAKKICQEVIDKKGEEYLDFVLDVCTINSARAALSQGMMYECLIEVDKALKNLMGYAFSQRFPQEDIAVCGEYAYKLFALGSRAGEPMAQAMIEKANSGIAH